MSKNKLIPYNPELREYARQLRNNGTLSEILLWQKIKNRGLGVQFHRQVPLLEYIVDFYCHEIQLAIEIDGKSHEYRYDHDTKRQGELEKRGVEFVRFSNSQIKNDMFSVISTLEEKVKELAGKTFINLPLRDKAQVSSSTTRTTPPSPPPQRGNKFPKKERLKSQKLIEKLFEEGKAITKFPFKLLYMPYLSDDGSGMKAGFVVPKKNFKSAVKRNRIKRLLREAYRLNRHDYFNNIKGNYALMILYLGKEIPAFIEVGQGIKQLLSSFLEKTSHEKNK